MRCHSVETRRSMRSWQLADVAEMNIIGIQPDPSLFRIMGSLVKCNSGALRIMGPRHRHLPHVEGKMRRAAKGAMLQGSLIGSQ